MLGSYSSTLPIIWKLPPTGLPEIYLYLCSPTCSHTYAFVICALMCVFPLCSHIGALICVLSYVLAYVCSHAAVSLSQVHPQHYLGSLAGIILSAFSSRSLTLASYTLLQWGLGSIAETFRGSVIQATPGAKSQRWANLLWQTYFSNRRSVADLPDFDLATTRTCAG